VLRLKKEHSYTSTPPLGLRGEFYVNFSKHFYGTKIEEVKMGARC
jgi:hypothetical protein